VTSVPSTSASTTLTEERWIADTHLG
jgi:hypothetical protein